MGVIRSTTFKSECLKKAGQQEKEEKEGLTISFPRSIFYYKDLVGSPSISQNSPHVHPLTPPNDLPLNGTIPIRIPPLPTLLFPFDLSIHVRFFRQIILQLIRIRDGFRGCAEGC